MDKIGIAFYLNRFITTIGVVMKLLMVVAAFIFPIASHAQELGLQNANDVSSALPPEVFSVLKNATAVKKIYPINPGDHFTGQILKADEIVFSPGGTITVDNVDAPFIIIAAPTWKFADGDVQSKIILAPARAKTGTDGYKGNDGANGSGEVNRNGNPGVAGSPGTPGEDGQALRAPHIYVLAGNVDYSAGATPTWIYAIDDTG